MAVKEAGKYEGSARSHSSVESSLPFSNQSGPDNRTLIIKPAVNVVGNDHYLQANHDKLEDDTVPTTLEGPNQHVSQATGLNEPRLSYGGSVDNRPGAFLPITPENYQSEAERIKSFVGWPLNETVHPGQLARVGFVYTGDGALVQCFQCGVKYRHWYKGDVPLNVHQKCNPRCPFLQTLTSKSKFLLSEQQSTRSYIQPESIGSNTQGEEVSKHSLQFPDYSEQTVRLQSFKHWGGVLPAQELAEGGFYMIARHDVVRCFSCNVVVQDWERSDNVIDEHNRDCSFLHRFVSSKGVSSAENPRVKWPDVKLSGSFKEDDQGKVPEDKQSCTTGGTSESVEDFRIDESCGPPTPDPQDDDVFTSDEVFVSVSDTSNMDSEQFMVSKLYWWVLRILTTHLAPVLVIVATSKNFVLLSLLEYDLEAENQYFY